EVNIPPIPLTIVILLTGGLYPCDISTPVAWAFSAPMTNNASGIEIETIASRLKLGTTICGNTKAGSKPDNENWLIAAATILAPIKAGKIAGIFLVIAVDNRYRAIAVPAIHGASSNDSIISVPNEIMAPTIIAITIGPGNHLITFPIIPLIPSNNTIIPATKYAPVASLNVVVVNAPAIRTAAGIENAPAIG